MASKTIVGRAAKRTMKSLTGVVTVPLESDDQKRLVEYMQTKYITRSWLAAVKAEGTRVSYDAATLWDYSYAVPNASKLAGSADQRARMMSSMKAQGLKTGVSDLVIALPAAEFHGAYLELKRAKGGRVDPEQAAWCHRMRFAGYFADIVAGLDQAMEFVGWYHSAHLGQKTARYTFKFEPHG